MAIEVVMPQMGESIVEGTITKWLKQPGDFVGHDEPLLEISTDKVDAEIPSPAAGILREIRVPVGETVQVNTVLAVIAESGEATAQAAPAPTADAAVASAVEVVMPQMGESIVEGTITKWLKQVGDVVRHDEPLFEISTDKVDAEIPSPVAGTLTEIRVAEGQTVTVNTVVAVIGGTAAMPVAASAPAVTAPQAAPVAASAPIAAAVSIDPTRKLRSSPLVRRIAKENQLDLNRVRGTGSAGRITKEDILQHLSQSGPGGISGSVSTEKAAAPQAQQTVPVSQSGQVVPMTKMRAIIADRMLESKRTSPHAHTIYKVDMTRIVRLREKEKARFEKQNGVKLTYMPFIAAAVVETLRKFPILNSSLVGNNIHYHPKINLGIAVALEWGLIVPVIQEAEERSFLGLARAIADLAERARSKKLLPSEVSGGTFTLTNSGVFGGEFGTPILNQPEAAILAIGGLKKEPVVMTDAEGNDTIAIRSMQYFCLGFDHRTIDGADSGKFMSELKKTLEGWNRPIL